MTQYNRALFVGGCLAIIILIVVLALLWYFWVDEKGTKSTDHLSWVRPVESSPIEGIKLAHLLADDYTLCVKCREVLDDSGDYPPWHPPIPVLRSTPDSVTPKPIEQLYVQPVYDVYAVDNFEIQPQAWSAGHSRKRPRISPSPSPGPTINPVVVPPAVPEPATWLIMLLGFAGIGHALRRGSIPGSRLKMP